MATTGRRPPRLTSNLALGFAIGVAVFVLIVGVAAIAIFATPTTSPAAPPAAPPASTPVAGTPADTASFRADANKQIDDMEKDLDDIVATVADDGFFRLYSNSIELAFNLAQLRAITAPESVADSWPPALDAIGTSLDTLDDAIGTRDGPTILGAIDGVRAQVEAARAVAQSAS